ncbi:MAG: hypothetical protein MJ252_23385, partial [archaeon]|nr:hypothetical protein [archaeon]
QKKYSKPENIFNYIRELETKINLYKIKEKDYEQAIEEKKKKLEKAERVNASLQNTLQKLEKKINMANELIASGKYPGAEKNKNKEK